MLTPKREFQTSVAAGDETCGRSGRVSIDRTNRQRRTCQVQRRIIKSLFRKRRPVCGVDPELSPLLTAVEDASPPEGLLSTIEREIDEMPSGRKAGAAPLRNPIVLSSGFAAAAGLAFVVNLGPADRSVLLDPAGRPTATLEFKGDLAEVRWQAGPASGDSAKTWHLWGLTGPKAPPTYLGPLGQHGLVVPDASRFVGFAMSLETAAFSGDRPLGPVLALSPAE